MIFDSEQDWFSHNIPNWISIITEPEKIESIVEIGNWEGRSTIWLADYCVNAKITTIDPSHNLRNRQRLLQNVAEHPRSSSIDIKFGFSENELQRISYNSADLIYIDGSHEAKDVLLDGLMCYKIVKTGGIIIFDDYAVGDEQRIKCDFIKRPAIGIDAFLSVIDCEIIHKGWQIIVRKPL